MRNSRRMNLQNFRGVVNYSINGSQPVLPSQPESLGTHLWIPGVSHLVMSLRNIAKEQRKGCQAESQVWQSKELQPPSHPPHQSQVEMSEITKIQRALCQGYFSKINFNDLLLRLNSFPWKTCLNSRECFPFQRNKIIAGPHDICCMHQHFDKNFLGISSSDTLSSPLRQAWLVLTD